MSFADRQRHLELWYGTARFFLLRTSPSSAATSNRHITRVGKAEPESQELGTVRRCGVLKRTRKCGACNMSAGRAFHAAGRDCDVLRVSEDRCKRAVDFKDLERKSRHGNGTNWKDDAAFILGRGGKTKHKIARAGHFGTPHSRACRCPNRMKDSGFGSAAGAARAQQHG